MKNTVRQNLGDTLKNAKHKATPRRIAILNVLKKNSTPLTVSQILEKLPITSNQTTIYRALEALTSTEVVKKIDFGDTGARYELNVGTNHHHHIVCKQCGKVEDIENCSSDELEKLVLKKSKSFTSIQNHALEFFGVCNKCS